MKHTAALFITLFVISCGMSPGHKQQTSDERALKTIRDFYTAYITEKSKVPPFNNEKIDMALNRFCTTNLIKQWKDLSEKMDGDLLLDGQYCRVEWLKTMVISKDKIRPNVYIVKFDYTDQEKQKVLLKVIEKEHIIYIDKIVLDAK